MEQPGQMQQPPAHQRPAALQTASPLHLQLAEPAALFPSTALLAQSLWAQQLLQGPGRLPAVPLRQRRAFPCLSLLLLLWGLLLPGCRLAAIRDPQRAQHHTAELVLCLLLLWRHQQWFDRYPAPGRPALRMAWQVRCLCLLLLQLVLCRCLVAKYRLL
jgi:hypothetical protein